MTGCPTESYASIEDRVRPVREKVISPIGYFDLDPNRALDVILNVLSAYLATHYIFFIALLSFSPWSASFRRPLSVNGPADFVVDRAPGWYKGKAIDEVLSLADCKPGDTKSMPTDSSARVMAQVLGFKFTYYRVHDQWNMALWFH